MESHVPLIVSALGARRRVLITGGLPVILHGLTRHTKDADIWLDPLGASEDWVMALRELAVGS